MTLLDTRPTTPVKRKHVRTNLGFDCFGPVEPFTKAMYLSVEPLRKAIERRLAAELNTQTYQFAFRTEPKRAEDVTAMWRLAERVHQFKPDCDLDSCRRALERVLHPATKKVHFAQADAMSLALGLHPSLLWGSEW